MEKNKFKVSGLRFKVGDSSPRSKQRRYAQHQLFSYSQFIMAAVLFCCTSIFANAQTTFSYEYDNAGNRRNRTIEMKSPAMTPPPQDSTDVVIENPEEGITDLQNPENGEEAPPKVYTDALAETQITIYPNPTKGLLTVKIANLPQQSVSNLTLFDMLGKVITQQSLSDDNKLDISAQAAGTYIMQIAVGDEVTSWKIIKQ